MPSMIELQEVETGLEGETIPGSFYQGPDLEWGYWHIGKIETVVFNGHEGIFCMVNNSHGDCYQGIAPPSDHALVVAIMDGLNTAIACELDAPADFDLLCDLVAANV